MASALALVNQRRAEGADRQDRAIKKNTESANKFTQSRIDALTEEAKLVVKSTKDVTKALTGAGLAFDEATNEIGKTAEEDEATRAARAAEAAKVALAAQKASAEKRRAQAKKDNEKRLKEQARALLQLIKGEESAAAQIRKLEEQVILNTLKNLEDGLEKELALEKNATDKRLAGFDAQSKRFEDEAKKRQDLINKAFGEGSEEALRAQENIGKQRLEITKQVDAAIEVERAASLGRQEDIREKFTNKEIAEAKKALQDRLTELQAEQTAIVSAAEQEQLKIREARAKGQIDATEADSQAFDVRVKALKDQIAQLDQQEFALIGEQGFGAEVAQEEFDKIAEARQGLNTQLAELDEEQTAKSVEESAKRGDKIREDFEKAAGAFSQAVGLVGQIADLANQKVIERIEKEEEEQAASLEKLEERLQTASGLEAQFLEEEIAREEKAAEDLAQKKIRAEKEALIAKKAVSITEAVINTALAISSALTAGPPLGFVLAGFGRRIGCGSNRNNCSGTDWRTGRHRGRIFCPWWVGCWEIARSRWRKVCRWWSGGRVGRWRGSD